MPKKRDILSEKRESGMALKKRDFTPESGIVTPMHCPCLPATARDGELIKMQHSCHHVDTICGAIQTQVT